MILGVNWAEALTALATVVLCVGVVFAAQQIMLTKEQARDRFEESLQREYRSIVRELPVEVFLERPLPVDVRVACLGLFYRYFNLTNTQARLANAGRIRKETWKHWQKGILSNLVRDEFRRAWKEISKNAPDQFANLRALERSVTSANHNLSELLAREENNHEHLRHRNRDQEP